MLPKKKLHNKNYCEKLIVKNYINEKHRKDGKIYKKKQIEENKKNA